MIAVQSKPSNFSLPAPRPPHRRHPSAPPTIAAVKPTKTPGLIALTKPISKPSQPKSEQRQQRSKAARPPVQEKPLLEPAFKLKETTPKVPRGRNQAGKPKEKEKSVARDSSISPVRRARPHGRQPSPPIHTTSVDSASSQAEAFAIPIPLPTTPSQDKFSTSNHFDPFRVESPASSPPRSFGVRPPALAERPTGMLAHRRAQSSTFAPVEHAYRREPVTPPRSKAIPIVFNAALEPQMISHSVPSSVRRGKHISMPVAMLFPVCDDSGNTSSDELEMPVTPTRARHTPTYFAGNGPRTAPLSTGATQSFPFNVSPGPFPQTPSGKRHHLRSPSEGIFFHSTSSDGDLPFADSMKFRAFASSGFQNSPSPEQLPDPNF